MSTTPPALSTSIVDLTVLDLEAAEKDAAALGANVVARHDGWTVMQDPDGNEFCIVAE